MRTLCIIEVSRYRANRNRSIREGDKETRGEKKKKKKKKKKRKSLENRLLLLRDWNSPLGARINRFLIILNSHQIELAGVTSSATHGVINEIMGINFD